VYFSTPKFGSKHSRRAQLLPNTNVFFVATCLDVLFDLGGHTAANDLSTQKFAEVYAIPYLLTRGGFFFFFSSSLK
jgi:hypothetical protein